jgi:hypothetical protein
MASAYNSEARARLVKLAEGVITTRTKNINGMYVRTCISEEELQRDAAWGGSCEKMGVHAHECLLMA